ncbi:MAG: class I SAM-dependent methyltransferase [Gemmatimonadaceae bacterium]|nr:class I SAM-dependent methyltransferase [Gloeobacterales cyanobacterium ES-bin-141]
MTKDDTNQALCHLIARRIAGSPNGRITFAEYMELALYDPEHGYYATNVANIGMHGDFFTSPHLGADFGELLGDLFVEMWQTLGEPAKFTLVEMGAGQGVLAADLLTYVRRRHPGFFEALEYTIVEKSAALVVEQRQRLGSFAEQAGKLHWSTLAEIEPDSVRGCFFANELVDAFPVHQFVIAEGKLQEIYVTARSTENGTVFQEVSGEPSTPIAEFFELVGLEPRTLGEGYRSEVNLLALDWLEAVAQRLAHGYLLTIDYGHTTSQYYHPTRAKGTLQCYYQHTVHDDPYAHVGRQDLTAHVNFTALERQAERCGLSNLGLTRQSLLLVAQGIAERIAALGTGSRPEQFMETLRRRDALHRLIDPQGLGNFGVLVQGKGLETALALKVLSMTASAP